MKKNGIYFYRANFDEYKKIGSEFVSRFPANDRDVYLYATFVFNGKIGFLSSQEGEGVIEKILRRSISIGSLGVRFPGSEFNVNDARFIICHKNESISLSINDYNNYVIAEKKFLLISRYRAVEKPARHFLADFIENGTLDHAAYEFIINNSYFIMRSNYSGIHGSGAFEIGSRGEDICQLYFMKNILNRYCCFQAPYESLPVF